MKKIEIIKTDITKLEVDALVNSSNVGLLEGRGVCGAIFRAAGAKELAKACDEIGYCEVGNAVVTPGFLLPAKYIIHTVGPQWNGGKKDEAAKLYNAYRSSIEKAYEKECHSIGFPLVSTGTFKYPKEGSFEEGIKACLDFFNNVPGYEIKVFFAVLDDESKNLGDLVLNRILTERNITFDTESQDGMDIVYSDILETTDDEHIEGNTLEDSSVKAELKYNPYILASEVSFNEKKPRANSLIEKYTHSRLEDWIDEVPTLFYGELNGYDFDLEFTGPSLEFELLESIFEEKVSASDNVKLIAKRILSDRAKVLSEISELKEWVTNPSEWIKSEDYKELFNEGKEVFDNTFSVFIYNGSEEDLENSELANYTEEYKYTIEFVDDISQLKKANLEYAPIVIYVDEKNRINLQEHIKQILRFKDVCDNQLFFIIRESLKNASIGKYLKDIGLNKPNILSSLNDKKIFDYIEAYPITRFVFEVRNVYRKKVDVFSEIILNEKREMEESNREIYDYLNNLDFQINDLEKKLQLVEDYEVVMPGSFVQENNNLVNAIRKYKERSIVIERQENGEKEAKAFAKSFERWANAYQTNLYTKLYKEIETVNDNFVNKIGINERFVSAKLPENPKRMQIPNLYSELVNRKVEVMQEETKFNFSRMTEEKNMVLHVRFLMDEWRQIVNSHAEEFISKQAEEFFKTLKEYQLGIKNSYIDEAQAKKKELIFEKKEYTERLSDDVKLLEEKIEWVKEFETKVEKIEGTNNE